jgi:hypothetical protein
MLVLFHWYFRWAQGPQKSADSPLGRRRALKARTTVGVRVRKNVTTQAPLLWFHWHTHRVGYCRCQISWSPVHYMSPYSVDT